MEFVKVLLYIIEVVVCVLLGLVVMIQKPKEGGLGGSFGGGALEASLGADAGNVLIRATVILGTIFLLNTLVLARITSTPSSVISAESEPAPQAAAPVAGEVPVVPSK